MTSLESHEKERAKFDLSSRKQYEAAKKQFYEIIRTKAWWRNNMNEQCENCIGDYLTNCKNCYQSYFIQEGEDCAYTLRGYRVKDGLYTISCLESELMYMSVIAQDKSYDTRFCVDLIQCKYAEYSAHCFNSQYLFGCCGLVNKKYCIFNKEHPPEEYHQRVATIKEQLRKEGSYGEFFPYHFAASSYDESIAGFHWPLSREEQEAQGYRTKILSNQTSEQHHDPSEIPDKASEADETLSSKTFWDKKAKRPFQIPQEDIRYCKENKVPLPNCFYIERFRKNFSLMFFTGIERETTCAISQKPITTSLPPQLDGRIISVEEYMKRID